jgi:hypothetical protein
MEHMNTTKEEIANLRAIEDAEYSAYAESGASEETRKAWVAAYRARRAAEEAYWAALPCNAYHGW